MSSRDSALRGAASISCMSTLHPAANVYADGALAWPMVARAGIVIFDDYEFDEIEDESERPKLGIDAFLKTVEGQYRLMHKAYQVVIAKR
jgi:hypothetical protein